MQTQTNPTHNPSQPSITQLIVSSPNCPDRLKPYFLAREQKGIETYGTTLQPFNGRNAKQDLLEELLDACQYAKQICLETSTDLDAHFIYQTCLRLASETEAMYNK
jgi:hypothetical protein